MAKSRKCVIKIYKKLLEKRRKKMEENLNNNQKFEKFEGATSKKNK